MVPKSDIRAGQLSAPLKLIAVCRQADASGTCGAVSPLVFAILSILHIYLFVFLRQLQTRGLQGFFVCVSIVEADGKGQRHAKEKDGPADFPNLHILNVLALKTIGRVLLT